MSNIDPTTLSKGDAIRVTYASDRSQMAVFHGIDHRDRIVVRKWSKTSRRWTGPVFIKASDIIERVDRAALDKAVRS